MLATRQNDSVQAQLPALPVQTCRPMNQGETCNVGTHEHKQFVDCTQTHCSIPNLVMSASDSPCGIVSIRALDPAVHQLSNRVR